MQGNGIDMYNLIPNLTKDDPALIFTNKKFWVGVIESLYPSPPVPRRKTRCFARYPVYILNDILVFESSDNNFYEIPLNEKAFIQ